MIIFPVCLKKFGVNHLSCGSRSYILAGVFEIPPFVSPACKDLISAMLVVDPLKRITIEEIR